MLVRADDRQSLNLRAALADRLPAVEDLEADRVGLTFHQPLERARLLERDVAAGRERVFRIAGDHDRILRELKEIAAEKAESSLDRRLNHAQRGHHANDRKHTDRDPENRERRTKPIRAKGRERDADGLGEAHWSTRIAAPRSDRAAMPTTPARSPRRRR